MKKTMTVREAMKERARGREWFFSLDSTARNELGDAFVLGEFDWRDWLSTKPSAAFLNGADDARVLWEMQS